MSDFTDTIETDIRDYVFSGTQLPTPPSTLYVSLHTSDPGETPDGSTEVSAADYSRYEIPLADWTDITSGGGTGAENTNEEVIGPAQNNWGTISHVGIWDSQTGGTPIASFAANSSTTIESGDEFKIAAGDLSFTID